MLSIIVPVYNVEKYLCQCIDSILAQTYRNFELILVDDGSPDRSPAICNEYAQRDERVKVIHKKNGGAQSAVREGVLASCGEYIGFVDSDDWIKPEMYETLMNLIKHYDLDCAMCKHEFHNEKTGEVGYSVAVKERLYIGEQDIQYICKCSERGLTKFVCLSLARWNKVFKREIIYDLLKDADVTLSLGEDIAVVYPALTRCSRFFFVDRSMYVYRVGIESVTGGDFKERYFEDHWKLRDALKPYESYMGSDSFNSWIFWQGIIALGQIIRSRASYQNKRNALLRIMRDPRMRELLPKVKHLPMTKRNRIFYYAIRMKRAAVLLAAAKFRQILKREKAK